MTDEMTADTMANITADINQSIRPLPNRAALPEPYLKAPANFFSQAETAIA